ncbi:hypothetical protein EVJ58_g6313 [Rhodofomes roseus]|uniref:Uncharacterized protein n=1 Tax=Rhodofomes roseus TaxID=34475 RepID=A0A4Y9Y8C4_9APHY|nr:hypothetical protein EVJ58_g6313 [Rhodofomes roseus]
MHSSDAVDSALRWLSLVMFLIAHIIMQSPLNTTDRPGILSQTLKVAANVLGTLCLSFAIHFCIFLVFGFNPAELTRVQELNDAVTMVYSALILRGGWLVLSHWYAFIRGDLPKAEVEEPKLDWRKVLLKLDQEQRARRLLDVSTT